MDIDTYYALEKLDSKLNIIIDVLYKKYPNIFEELKKEQENKKDE